MVADAGQIEANAIPQRANGGVVRGKESGLGNDLPRLAVPPEFANAIQAQSVGSGTVGVSLTAQVPLPRTRVRQVVTQCVVWDAQTVMLGGLISEDITSIKDKMPVLGDLPLLGRLFRSETKTNKKKNLVIFVTPTIIDPAGNRVHTDEEMPFTAQNTPPQPQFIRQ